MDSFTGFPYTKVYCSITKSCIGWVDENTEEVLLPFQLYSHSFLTFMSCRYSEFDKLRHNLVHSFPQAGAALPEIHQRAYSVSGFVLPKYTNLLLTNAS
jgi:hypothetical protein